MVAVLLLGLLALWAVPRCADAAGTGSRKAGKSKARGKPIKKVPTTPVPVPDANGRSVDDPFENFAKYLVQSSAGKDRCAELDEYDADRVRRAVKKLAKSQDTLKTMDGAAHHVRSTFSGSSTSLTARFDKFMGGSQKKMKEAGKLYEYVTTVERGLQAAEILQAVACGDDAQRAVLLAGAGLREVKRVVLARNHVRCVLSLMAPTRVAATAETVSAGLAPHAEAGKNKSARRAADAERRFEEGELVVGVVDECSGDAVDTDMDADIGIGMDGPPAPAEDGRRRGRGSKAARSRGTKKAAARVASPRTEAAVRLLRVLTERDVSLPLHSVGLVKEEVTVQPTLMGLAVDALQALGDYVLPAAPVAAPAGNGTTANATAAASAGTASPKEANESASSSVAADVPAAPALARGGQPLPRTLRLLGHSAGGAVAAYAAMVLEGFLNSTSSNLTAATAPFVGALGSGLGAPENGTGTGTGTGKARRSPGRVSCLCLGPPPCVSRAVVPRFVSSVICGDDVVPRATRDALLRARDRVVRALKAGAGEKIALGWMVGSGWMSDLQSVAGRGLGQYTGGGHDLSALSVPGRAFYVKSRQFKQGASMQRVLRGQWREDLLWMLHDVLFSAKMLEHHSLDAYIRTLARC